MKGVVLAGGLGTRLHPLTRVVNKHLLPVYNQPMIFYPLQALVNAGIREILIVTGGQGAGDFLRLLSNGKDFGLKHLNYAYQEGEGVSLMLYGLRSTSLMASRAAWCLGTTSSRTTSVQPWKPSVKSGARTFC